MQLSQLDNAVLISVTLPTVSATIFFLTKCDVMLLARLSLNLLHLPSCRLLAMAMSTEGILSSSLEGMWCN